MVLYYKIKFKDYEIDCYKDSMNFILSENTGEEIRSIIIFEYIENNWKLKLNDKETLPIVWIERLILYILEIYSQKYINKE